MIPEGATKVTKNVFKLGAEFDSSAIQCKGWQQVCPVNARESERGLLTGLGVCASRLTDMYYTYIRFESREGLESPSDETTGIKKTEQAERGTRYSIGW